MNEANTLNELRVIHDEFLNSRYFSAPSIMTPRKEWLSIDRNDDSSIEEVCKKAEDNGISNLVVMDGQRVSGFLNVNYIRERNGRYKLEWDKMGSIEDHSFPENTHLSDLIKDMVREAESVVEREMSPLYFVVKSQKGSKEPIVIISFWDLNRAPAYILSYPILVYLEHTLISKIEDSHIGWVEHRDLASKMGKKFHKLKDRDNKRFNLFMGGPKYDYTALSKWSFQELIFFYRNDPHVIRDPKEIPEGILDLFTRESNRKNLRNIIAHTVNLIVDQENFKQDLKDLDLIWNYGKILFYSFGDHKLSYSEPFLLEKGIDEDEP